MSTNEDLYLKAKQNIGIWDGIQSLYTCRINQVEKWNHPKLTKWIITVLRVHVYFEEEFQNSSLNYFTYGTLWIIKGRLKVG